MSHLLQPTILLLREGTDTSQGIPQLVSNINACTTVVEVLKTTLGPRGMDKLIYSNNGKATISNDGATIIKLLDIVHPAAQTLVEIAKSQDDQVGDGTTSVVVLAGELLLQCKEFVEEGVPPQIIIRGFRTACQLAIQKIKEISIKQDMKDENSLRNILEKCASTSMNSKLISTYKEYFSKMVVDAVLHLDVQDMDIKMIGIKKEKGGSLNESQLIEGVAFKKTFSYAGFEQQPKKFENPKVLLLNVELELKSEKENAEIRIDDPNEYQSIVEAEWNIIYEKLENCVKSGAKVILSRLAIGDLGTQYFADRGLFCAGRVSVDDMNRVMYACGGNILTTTSDIREEALGYCGLFEERQVGAERYNFFSGCKQAKSVTILLRGCGEQFTDEAERSLHDAIMVVQRARKYNSSVVAGGGAIEMEISKYLREHSRTIEGKQQLIISRFAQALEVIPRTLSDNAGFDSTDILNKLRYVHAKGPEGKWFGVDINTGGITDTFDTFVWEPSIVKINSITAATEAACLILSIDETVKNPKSEDPK